MCGISAVWEPPGTRTELELLARATAMAGVLRHRGPDDDGAWARAEQGVALAHTRLSVVDLSPTGRQPMVSADGRWTLVFNGEVYNHLELRDRLRHTGVRPRGTSDTEILLEAVAAWGPEKAIGEVNGMFALALWDRRDACLLLARDRMGEKPLYYGAFGRVFLAASELKSLHPHPSFHATVDPAAVALYLRHGYVPAPFTIFQGVRKLSPGCLLRVRDGVPGEPEAYWRVETAAAAGHDTPWNGSDREAVDAVGAVLRDAVRLRMRADVPVGAFLSGGIDSSLVVALMREHTARPVRTFTVGFTEPAYDESPAARAVAAHLGTDHTELIVTPAEAQAVVPTLAEIYDEPFADSSQIPTCLLAALTRRHVTVSLSGDGGDELFAGYTRYAVHDRLRRALAITPPALRARLARALEAGDARHWEDRLRPAEPLLRRWAPPGRLGERVVRLGSLLEGDPAGLYRRLLSVWPDAAKVAPHVAEPPDAFPRAPASLPARGSARPRVIDQRHYLPDDILVKVDRATMAVGLEARVPLLDHRLVELSWRLPEHLLLRGTTGKRILRTLLAAHVPPRLTDRPKTGFGVPIGAWLRGPLRPWAEDLLGAPRLARHGLLDPVAVRTIWLAHRDGQADHGARLWTLLMLQAWSDRWTP